jgi:hypothetical protein
VLGPALVPDREAQRQRDDGERHRDPWQRLDHRAAHGGAERHRLLARQRAAERTLGADEQADDDPGGADAADDTRRHRRLSRLTGRRCGCT